MQEYLEEKIREFVQRLAVHEEEARDNTTHEDENVVMINKAFLSAYSYVRNTLEIYLKTCNDLREVDAKSKFTKW